MAKNESWLKKIARFNSTKAQQNKRPSSTKQQEAVTPTKKWPKYVIGALILGVIASGIAIPLGIAAKKEKEDFPIIKPAEVVFKFKTADGKEIVIPFDQLEKQEKNMNEGKYIYSNLEDEVALFLYKQEYKASARYEAIYNANKVSSKKKSFKLQSIKQIEDSKKANINELKLRLQKQFGIGKWEDKFKEELAKPQYGQAKNEQEAIKHLVAQRIKRDAFRRFEVAVNTDWTLDEVKNGIKASADVKYTWYNDETKKDEEVKLFNKGDVIKFGKDLNFIKLHGEKQNAYTPQSVKTKEEAEIKVHALLTSSFVDDKKDAGIYLNDWISQEHVVYSKLTLPFIPNEESAELPFKVTKDSIKKILKFTDFKADETGNKTKIDLLFNRLKDFKGISNFVKGTNLTSQEQNQAKNDKTILEALSNANAESYGSDGFKSISKIYENENASFYVPFVSIIDNNSIFTPKVIDNFFEQLFEKVKSDLFNNEEEIVNLLSKKDIEWTKETAVQAEKDNKLLELKINEIENFETKMGNIIRDILGQSETDKKVSTVYKLNGQTAILNSNGLHFISTATVKTEEQARKLILSDIEIKSKEKKSKSLRPILNIETIFKEMFTPDYIILSILNNNEFIEFAKNQNYKDYSTEKDKKFSQEDIEMAKKYTTILNGSRQLSLLNQKTAQIKEYIEQLVNNELNTDFVFDQILGKWVVKNHNEKDFLGFIYPIIEKKLNNKGDK
ncbi:HinT-interacting membrane complex protein P80 [Mycoplasma phocoenae]|uniref:Membrane protein P80 n=1 Tax=Mycoplasma phocoenae TaxID=754517 RepID=A0A858U3H0_9MOLU|nr:hypothetical protein [Mycoplasma phocoenae]QJG66962.1 hypothetical protein HGG69_01325 [Mycoplasma phocoenae]